MLAAVVGGQRGQPVAEQPVQLGQVGDRRLGRLLRIHALVDPVAALETESVAGRRDELPEPERARRGVGPHLEAALDDRHPGQLERHAGGAKLVEDHRPVLAAAGVGLEEELPLGAAEAQDLALHVLVDLERNRPLEVARRGRPRRVDLDHAPRDQPAQVFFFLGAQRVALDVDRGHQLVGGVEGGERLVDQALLP